MKETIKKPTKIKLLSTAYPDVKLSHNQISLHISNELNKMLGINKTYQ